MTNHPAPKTYQRKVNVQAMEYTLENEDAIVDWVRANGGEIGARTYATNRFLFLRRAPLGADIADLGDFIVLEDDQPISAYSPDKFHAMFGEVEG